MQFIRQNATHKVVLGPTVAVGDGFTPVTTLSLSTADEAEAILHDNGTVVDISGYTWAAITTADGYYHLTLQSGITSTVGHLTILVNDDSLCLPIKADFTVIEEAVYDALYAASAAGPLQSTTAGRTLDVAATGEAGVDFGNTTGVISTAAAATLVDDVWDEVLTGASHNVTNSAGKRLRQLDAAFVVAAGTAQAGAAGTITLAAGESSTDDIFEGDRVIIIGGTGIGEHGIITTYNGTTKVATMSQNWVVTPDATSEYELTPADCDVETWQHTVVTTSSTSAKPEVDTFSISDAAASANNLELTTGAMLTGTCSGTPTTTTTDTDLSNANDVLIGRRIVFISGTAVGQAATIIDFANTNGVVTFPAIAVAPVSGDTVVIV